MRKTDAKHGNALMSERLEIQSLLGGVFWIQKLVMYLGNAWTKWEKWGKNSDYFSCSLRTSKILIIIKDLEFSLNIEMDESLFQSGTSTVTHLTFKYSGQYRIYSTELDCVTCHLIRRVTNDACSAFQIKYPFLKIKVSYEQN